MKNITFYVIASFLFLSSLFLSACAGATTSASVIEPIRIGSGYDLSNEMSVVDLPTANGIKLAIKEINEAGGLLGRPVELVLRDHQYKRDVTANIAKQFVEEDKVDAVVSFSDADSVLAGGPLIQRAGLPLVISGATSPKLPEQVGDMTFLAVFGDNVQAAAAAEFAFKNFGETAFLLWDDGADYTVLLARYFNQSFTQLGGEVVLMDSFPDSATDFSPYIEKLKALPEQPDFYFLSAMPHNAGPLIKQFREAGLTAPIVGGDAYDFPGIVTEAGVEAVEDVYFTTHALMDPESASPEIKKFGSAYQAEYGHAPENVFAALGYDAMQLMANAIERAGSTDAKAIKKALEETKDFAALTGSITLTAQSHIPSKAVTMIAIRDGKFTLAEEIVPEAVPVP
ncbi:MAG TPA: ABC transporter substrate-binding protein [Anaerolineae bacterium]|nr:ABC transporter substrate-binding protein [Anaerolineae bacterium]HMR62614.1 ABC transporter substrate-binding protein [Anaerolineae bacterium]